MHLLITAFSKENNGGLYHVQFDTASATFSPPAQLEVATGCLHASYYETNRLLAIAANTVAEDGSLAGSLLVRTVKSKGSDLHIEPLVTAKSGGATACYASFNSNQHAAYLAHYSSPSVAALQLTEDFGSVAETVQLQRSGSSIDSRRQTEPHPHCSAYSHKHSSLWCADLGTDEVIVWPICAATGIPDNSKAQAIALPPGSGPRHVVFHPELAVAYVINELNSTVSTLQAVNGQWQLQSSVTTVDPAHMKDNYLSTAAISPCRQFLLVANRGHDSLSVFKLDAQGVPQAQPQSIAAEGSYPTFLSFDADGQWLFVANQKSNQVVAFSYTSANGAIGLSPVATVECPMPTWVQPIDLT